MFNTLKEKDRKAFAFIRNKFIHYGQGPTLREINEVTGGKSPRSASIVVERLIKAGLVGKNEQGLRPLTNDYHGRFESNITVDVPLVGKIACGTPILAEENIETYIPVSIDLAKKGHVYYLLRASGSSMNLAGIEDGDILLIHQQETAENNDKVVALINEEATVKFFERTDQAVILKPKSTDATHKPIVVTDNLRIQGIVSAVLPADLC
jgi:repressor LexA